MNSFSMIPGLARMANHAIFAQIPRFSTILESSVLIVIQNAENPGPSGQKFSKPPLKELDEALELLSDED